jgi:methyl-accepting chemotaxis protein
MADNTVNIQINVGGNVIGNMTQINNTFEEMTSKAKDAVSVFEKIGKRAFELNSIIDVVSNIRDAFNNAIAPGIAFDASLRELSAVTGETGEGLKLIGEYCLNQDLQT